MEKFNMEYSKKNIPIPSQEKYKVYFKSKVEKFIKRMRWKALQFLGKFIRKTNIWFSLKELPPSTRRTSQL